MFGGVAARGLLVEESESAEGRGFVSRVGFSGGLRWEGGGFSRRFGDETQEEVGRRRRVQQAAQMCKGISPRVLRGLVWSRAYTLSLLFSRCRLWVLRADGLGMG